MRNTKPALLLLCLLSACGGAMADGVGKYSVTTTNDAFTNSGTIRASSTAVGGVALAVAAQRAIAPALAVSFDYSSSGNRYVNQGTIEAKSKATGGASYAVAGQEVIR